MAAVLPVETLVEAVAVAVQASVDILLQIWVMVSVPYLLVKVDLVDLVEVMDLMVSILNSIQTQVVLLRLDIQVVVEVVVITVLLLLVVEEELDMVI